MAHEKEVTPSCVVNISSKRRDWSLSLVGHVPVELVRFRHGARRGDDGARHGGWARAELGCTQASQFVCL